MVDEKKKVLIVDDDDIQLASAEIILRADYNVLSAKSGKLALEHLYNGFVPDLILLDILMPEMDGFEAYNRIRAISLLQDIPVVFLTAVNETDEVQRALDIGAADYITKPYNKENLLCRIKNAIKIYEFRKSSHSLL